MYQVYQVLKTVTHKDAKQLSPDLFVLRTAPYPVRVGVSLVYINYCYVKNTKFLLELFIYGREISNVFN